MSVIRPKRTKIGADPNNTAWARNETSFGQRFMRSQGWTPGAVLGDPTSHHFGMHSTASTSYIRVALKDDSNGLGWKPGGPDGDDALTGMDVLKNIFGKLNGKGGEEGRREQERKRGLMYLGARGGRIAFVRGGLLMGDEMKGVNREEEKKDDEDENNDDNDTPSEDNDDNEEESKENTESSKSATPEPRKKESKEDKAARKATKAAHRSAKALRKAADKQRSEAIKAQLASGTLTSEEKKALKREWKERKEAKRLEREEKRRRRKRRREKEGKGERVRQMRVVVRSRLSEHKKAPVDADALKRLFMVG